jgi:hypothetical protein
MLPCYAIGVRRAQAGRLCQMSEGVADGFHFAACAGDHPTGIELADSVVTMSFLRATLLA